MRECKFKISNSKFPVSNRFFWNEHGFTLIEMIGLLAVIAIMAAVIAPDLLKIMQSKEQGVEEAILDDLAHGLMKYVLDSRIIPQSGEGTGTWATNIASYVELPSSNIYETDLSCSRRYWFDPATNLNGLTDNSATYNQNTVSAANLSGYSTGSTASPPSNARAMIISDITSTCSNNILVASVAHNTANFAAVWDQTGTLTESDTLKIKRVNFSPLFKTLTLISGNGYLFSRSTYQTPAKGTLTPVAVLIVEENSHIFSISYGSGGFEPTTMPGGTASLDIGTAPTGTQFIAAGDVTSAVASSPTTTFAGGTTPITSTSIITVYAELTIDGSNYVFNGNSGYIDVSLEYVGEPQYKLQGQSGDPTTITITTAGTPEIVSFNVFKGTEVLLYDQTLTGGVGNLLLSTVIKESETFYYYPGPPTVWGR